MKKVFVLIGLFLLSSLTAQAQSLSSQFLSDREYNKFVEDASGNVAVRAVVSASNSPTDEDCLTYEETGSTTEWQACSGSSATAYDAISDPDDNSTIGFGGFVNSWTTNETASDFFNITNSGNFGDVSLMVLQSTGNPTDGTMFEIINTDTNVDSIVAPNFSLTQDGKIGVGETGLNNMAVGHSALGSLTTGQFNTAGGLGSLGALTEGNRNTAYGYNAFDSLTTSQHNAGFGVGVGQALTDGNRNSLFGYHAMQASTGTRNDNAIFGYSAATSINGSQNVFFGSQAGLNNADTTVTNSGCIGYDCRAEGDNIFSIGGPTPFNVGIGTSSPTSLLSLSSSQTVPLVITNTATSGSSIGAYIDLITNDGSATSSGDRLGGVFASGNSDGTAISKAASISFFASQNWSVSQFGSSIVFETTQNNTTTKDEKMRINHDGKVGISDITPDALLEISQSGGANPSFYISSDDGNDGDIFRVNGSGNVGIGYTSISTKLAINGNVGIGVTSARSILDIDKGTGYGQVTIDGSSGGCFMIRDTDDAGWTECSTLNGTLSCTTDADGVCDGS